MRRGLTVALVALVLATGACRSGGGRAAPTAPVPAPAATTVATAPTTTSTTVDPHLSTVAVAAVDELAVFESPGAAEPVHRLENPQRSAAIGESTPLVLLVQEKRTDWLKVMLPIRPNGSTGFVRASDVTLETHRYRILVELAAYRITVWRGDEVILQEPVGLGRGAAPTTQGRFYTKELLKVEGQPVFGPYAYALSGFSEVYYEFAGGPGTLGIHGTNDPSGLGRSVSSGCIRMSNSGITTLAETLPVGVPVEIRA